MRPGSVPVRWKRPMRWVAHRPRRGRADQIAKPAAEAGVLPQEADVCGFPRCALGLDDPDQGTLLGRGPAGQIRDQDEDWGEARHGHAVRRGHPLPARDAKAARHLLHRCPDGGGALPGELRGACFWRW
jgi:hypothetical protein